MFENLNMDNVMTVDQVDSLFTGTTDTVEKEESTDKVEEPKETKETKIADVKPEELFKGSQEVVGSDKDNSSKDSTSPESGRTASPNFYSSTASALKDDGVLPDLDDETISKIKTPEDLSEAINKQISAKFDERQKRINDALENGVQPDAVKQFEETLSILDNISDDDITDETEKGVNLRKQLIYNDAINRGFSKERALRTAETSINNSTDIEDAREALESTKEYFGGRYNDLINQAKNQEQEYRETIKKQAEKFKKSLLEDKEVIEGLDITKDIRQKAYESMTKPVVKDEDGNWLTPIQKYEKDNPLEFRKKLSIIFALTDNFNNINNIIKGPVKKQVTSKLRELEHAFNTTRTNADGSLKLVTGVNDDISSNEDLFKNGWKLNI